MTHKSAFLSLLILFLFALLFSAWAERSENNPPISLTLEKGGFEQSSFTLEVTDNLITLQAEQASFKEILNDLEKKTGIKVNIFKEVVDRKAIEIRYT